MTMLMIFISVVTCSGGDESGICTYKNEFMIFGAGIMMSVMGMKIFKSKDKSKKHKRTWFYQKYPVSSTTTGDSSSGYT